MVGSGLRPFAMLALAASMGCALPLAGQAGTPAPDKDAETYRLSVQVKRVILDVVVTDAAGKPVEGLGEGDFKVLENGVVQPLRSFDVHTASVGGVAQPPLDLHLPPNTFSNLTLSPPDKPVTILLYDALNTPQDYLPYAHQELVRFIKAQKSSTRIAIFVLSDRLHMLQGFTDDETRLTAAIGSKSLGSHISQLLTADTGSDVTALIADPAGPALTNANGPTNANITLKLLHDVEGEEEDFLLQDRIQTTVQAFINIARFASSLPGRKNLVWMAGAFPIEIWPGRTLSGGMGGNNLATPLDNELREAQSLLKDSRVAIYPVDVRGLRLDPTFSAAAASPAAGRRGSATSAPPLHQATFGEVDAGEHAIMDAIAEESGGQAFYNTNGIKEAMDTAVRQGSEYYSLTYAPSNAREDGGERSIKVSVDKPGYHLVYRERYLAPDTAHPVPARPLVQDMNMQHGAPDSSELFFEAKVFPVGGAMPASATEEASMGPFIATNARINHTKAATGPQTVQHYGIDIAVIGRALEMPPAGDGKYATDMSFGLAAYTQDGELLNGTEIDVKNDLPAARYRKIQSDGYHASMVFAVPKESTSLRIGVRDEIGHRIGTMEIPLPVQAASRTLPPGTATQ